MKKKKGKRYKVKIINKKKFIRSITITILILVALIAITVFAILTRNKNENNTEETQGEVVNSESENMENQNETNKEENVVQENSTEENTVQEGTENTEAASNGVDIGVEYVVEENIDTEIQTLIQTIMEQNGLNENNFGFFYYNVNQNIGYEYNENQYFQGASTIKVPVSMLYYDKINAGTMTKESTLKYTQDSYEAGAGSTAARYKVGSSVPLGFLIEQAIVNSDNTAVNIMIKNLGYSNCKKEIQKYSNEEMPAVEIT